jgi:hypothetical protein
MGRAGPGRAARTPMCGCSRPSTGPRQPSTTVGTTLAPCGLLADDIAWHVPGRSPIAGHYHGPQEVLGYFAARLAHAKATFRVLPGAILADDEQAVQRADPSWSATASCGPGRPSRCSSSLAARSRSAGWCRSTCACSTNSGPEPLPWNCWIGDSAAAGRELIHHGRKHSFAAGIALSRECAGRGREHTVAATLADVLAMAKGILAGAHTPA